VRVAWRASLRLAMWTAMEDSPAKAVMRTLGWSDAVARALALAGVRSVKCFVSQKRPVGSTPLPATRQSE